MMIKDRLKDFFTAQPFPETVFQLSVTALSGFHLEGREAKNGRHVILSLRPGSLEPSFDRPNLKDPAHIADRLQDAFKKLGLRDGTLSLLMPESCLKSSILAFDDLPDSPAERERLVLWRLKKQMPSLPEDIRLSYDVLNSARPWRVFVSVVHSPVLAEYETLFSRQGAVVKNVSLATLSLANLLPADRALSGIVANLEEDGLSLLAVVDSEVIFYRSKPFLPDSREAKAPARRMENIAREILNTVTFLEDKEKKKVETLWVRAAPAEAEDEALAALKTLVPLSIRTLEPSRFPGLKAREARFLAPLIGQLP